jgi:hypothetical protein
LWLRCDAGEEYITGVAEEGAVGEDESEGGLQAGYEDACLQSEGFACDAAAMEAEDARGC